MFERGKIVLLPFPFTDLTATKVRPALIVSEPRFTEDDLIVVFISSRMTKGKRPTDVLLLPTETNFAKTGLKVPSVIRCTKLATLDKKIVLGEMGQLSPPNLKAVDKALKLGLGL